MSDQNPEAEAQALPEDQLPGQEQNPGDQQAPTQEFLTKDDLQRMREELRQELTNEAVSRFQGFYDQTYGTMRARINSLESLFEEQAKSGQPVPENVKTEMRNKAILEAQMGNAPQGQQAPASATPPARPPQGNPINQMVGMEIDRLQQETGQVLTPQDQQQLMAGSYPTPFAFIDAVKQHLANKAQTSPQKDQKPSPAARMPNLTQGKGADNLLQQKVAELERLQREPFKQGNPAKITQLTAEIQQLMPSS